MTSPATRPKRVSAKKSGINPPAKAGVEKAISSKTKDASVSVLKASSIAASNRRKVISELALSQQLAETLKDFRIDKELSQEQLGALAELDRTAIGAIESRRANPSLFTLSIICHVLEISLSELLSRITVDMNIKPTWEDTDAIKRRKNHATATRKDTATARNLR
jgi:transcriptional regulator with XRE-family HTH domain